MKHFNEILVTLGASQIELVHETEDWTFWKAIYQTPVSNVEGSYLYLKHKCPLKEATAENRRKWNEWSSKSGFEAIVTPRSQLAQNLNQTQSAFSAQSIRTSKQLLLDNFLKGMAAKPIEYDDEYFIDPDIELSDGKTAHDATQFLSDWMLGKSKYGPSSRMSVLIANGGIGKTTVARFLCSRLLSHDANAIPILVESDQWKNLVQTTLTMDTIWDLAIARRFDHASRLIANETALRVLVREGL